MQKTVIKCKDCSFKYYDGDVHSCPAFSVEQETKAVTFNEEPKEPEDNRETKKTRKSSFKIWEK